MQVFVHVEVSSYFGFIKLVEWFKTFESFFALISIYKSLESTMGVISISSQQTRSSRQAGFISYRTHMVWIVFCGEST